MTNDAIAALANAAAAQTDHTKAPDTTEYEREVAAPGKGLMRFREYIELGKHPNATAAFPNKAPSRKARFIFELVTPRHIQTFKKEDGTEVKVPHVLGVTLAMPDTGKPAHPKSAYAKLFAKLNYDGTLQHPAQALGRGYVVDIIPGYDKDDVVNGKPKEGAKPKYANIKDADGSFTISRPSIQDPLSGDTKEIPVPELMNELKIFLYDNPTVPTWDSIYIEGTYQKDGKDVSKNWIQETIMKALDFEGSKLHQLLSTGDSAALDGLPTGNQPAAQPVNQPPVQQPVNDPLAGFGL